MSLKNLKLENSDDIMILARIAEQSEQYEDMIDILKPLVEQKESDLTVDERNILQVAYKNAIGLKRIAWKAANGVVKVKKYKEFRKQSTEYCTKLEEELVNMCKDMLNLINKNLMPRAKKEKNIESQVFYHKLQGDYFRYVAEVGQGERLEKATERALNSYNEGMEKAEQLSPADPTRLSLQLNFAVFCYENLDEKEQAEEMAKQAFDVALSDMGDIDKSKAQESATVLQFLKDNLEVWKKNKQKQELAHPNFFSQQDSEAQFINQEVDDDDDY